MRRAQIVRECLLEAINGRPLRDQGRPEGVDDSIYVFVRDVLTTVGKEYLTQRAAPTPDVISVSSSTSSQWSF
jgi:hypothetical protein